MSRFLSKSKIDLRKINEDAEGRKLPFKNIYGTKEDDRVYVNMEAIDEIASQMKTSRDIALIVDLSGSMRKYYKDGSVENFCIDIIKELLPYDNDGIDLMFFASSLVYEANITSINQVSAHVQKAQSSRGSFGTTMPLEAFEEFTSQLKKKGRAGTVLFLTDGSMDDRGVKLKRFYQNVLHEEFKTRDKFYCYAIEFGKSASNALNVLDGLYEPEQGPEDLFDIHKTNSLEKLSDVLSQVAGMSSVSSNIPMIVSVNSNSGISMINERLIIPEEKSLQTMVNKIMSIGVKTNDTFIMSIEVQGYNKMDLQVTPSGESVNIEILDSQENMTSEQPATNGLSLVKGQKISLTKNNPTLDELYVGLGWDVNNNGQDFDLDVQAFLLNDSGKVPDTGFFSFYNQPVTSDGSVEHTGDNRTGQGDGDDESLYVRLSKVDQQVQKILFTVTIHDAQSRNQNFGNVQNSFIRIVDKSSEQEILKYELTDDYQVETSLVVGEIYRHNGEWKFNAVGAGYQEELLDFCNRYGVQIG